MSDEFDFPKWCERTGLTKKTADILKEQDLDVLEAISLLDQSNVQDLGLTKGQAKLLFKAISGLKPKQPLSKADSSKPISTTSLAKDQGLEEVLKTFEDGGELDALMACAGLDDLQQQQSLANDPLNATRIDLNPHVYLGKPPTSGKAKEDKPLLIPDFVDAYAGVSEPEEHEIRSTGGAQVIVRAHKKKAPQLQAISLCQWMGASMKILNVLLVQNRMEIGALQDYLAYMVKISELIKDHTWQSVILHDNEYRKLQQRHQFRLGSDSQHLHTRFLKKQQASLPSTKQSIAASAHKPPSDVPICKSYNPPTGCHWLRCKFQHICIAQGCGQRHPGYTHTYTAYNGNSHPSPSTD